MAAGRKLLMRALRSGNHHQYKDALARLPDLPWDLKDEVVPCLFTLLEARPKTRWSPARPERIDGPVDQLYRILSAGVKVYQASYEQDCGYPDGHLRRGIAPFVPRWAMTFNEDPKKLQKLKDDPIEQKAEAALYAIRQTWGDGG